MKGLLSFKSLLVVSFLGLLFCGGVVVYFGGYFVKEWIVPSNERDNNDPEVREEMIVTAIEWGRLAELPESATEFKINTIGNNFSRSFYFKFKAPLSDINKWLSEAKEIKEVGGDAETYNSRAVHRIEAGRGPEWWNPRDRGSLRIYEIPKDKNADHGGIYIDDENEVVHVYVAHS